MVRFTGLVPVLFHRNGLIISRASRCVLIAVAGCISLSCGKPEPGPELVARGIFSDLVRYKNEPNEDYVGFIAEDVPDLIAVAGRDALSTMDIVAMLTRVVQQQQNKINELETRLDAMQP